MADKIPSKEIAVALDIPVSRVRDIARNKSFNNGEEIKPAKIHQHLIDINGHLLTIAQIEECYGIPYNTIDRWNRDNLDIWKMIQERSTGKSRINLGKTKSQKDIDSDNLAKQVRQDYKNGIIGKVNYEKNLIKKSRYLDILGNRTNKEDIIWWK